MGAILRSLGLLTIVALNSVAAGAADDQFVERDGRWFADQGDGTYRNPVLIGDYSDPDAIRVGDDFYLTSSSFSDTPGLPILHSRDLVNWTIIGHALTQVPPQGHYSTPRRGGGVWAPAIRHHDGRFLIYYPDPDRGIFVVTASDPRGPWSEPILVDQSVGIIDPAPFWDDDGTGWLAYAFAMSRAGRANVIGLKRLSADGTATQGTERIIIDGSRLPLADTSVGRRPWQTTEGPKLYKKDGWYYIFAPSGSVKGGWQGVFRSRSIAGPYEARNVMDQGGTDINGPHQGAWVSTPSGEDWFLHFQDRDSYGRIVHLQPMKWANGWPVIGVDDDGDGRGVPVSRYRKPALPVQPASAPVASDEFASGTSLAWQFGSNSDPNWKSVVDGRLRLDSVAGSPDLYEFGAILSQKLPSLQFSATTKMRFSPKRVGERAGLSIHGTTFAWIGAQQEEGEVRIVLGRKEGLAPGASIHMLRGPAITGENLWLRASVRPEVISVGPPDFSPYWPSMLRETHMSVSFSYSLDGATFIPLGTPFQSRPGRWVGAQLGLFSQAAFGTPAGVATSVGYAEFEWFRVGNYND